LDTWMPGVGENTVTMPLVVNERLVLLAQSFEECCWVSKPAVAKSGHVAAEMKPGPLLVQTCLEEVAQIELAKRNDFELKHFYAIMYQRACITIRAYLSFINL
jgi:hypothetical protein